MTFDATAVRIDDASTIVVGADAGSVSEVIRLRHGLVALVVLRDGGGDQ